MSDRDIIRWRLVFETPAGAVVEHYSRQKNRNTAVTTALRAIRISNQSARGAKLIHSERMEHLS